MAAEVSRGMAEFGHRQVMVTLSLRWGWFSSCFTVCKAVVAGGQEERFVVGRGGEGEQCLATGK